MSFLTFIITNKIAITVYVHLGVTAAVKTSPLPGTTWTVSMLYAWFYDWTHQMLNITNTRPGRTQATSPS